MSAVEDSVYEFLQDKRVDLEQNLSQYSRDEENRKRAYEYYKSLREKTEAELAELNEYLKENYDE